MKVGVFIDSFNKPFDEGLDLAQKYGFSGIQMYASPYLKASKQEKKDLLTKIKDKGLEISAIGIDTGYKMLFNREGNEWLMDMAKRLFDLAYDLGVKILTSHIGVVPADKNSKWYDKLYANFKELADYAYSASCIFAVETGPEPSVRLKEFLDNVNSKGAGVNLDPANLVNVHNEDPVQAVYNLKDYIVHTHAKDGRWIKKSNPEALYLADIYNIPPQERGHYQEVAIGEGMVPWEKYLNALKDIGYDGYLTIERENGDNRVQDIVNGRKILEGLLHKL